MLKKIMLPLKFLRFYFELFITEHLKWSLGLMVVYDAAMLYAYSYATPTLNLFIQIGINGLVSMIIAMLLCFIIVCPMQIKEDMKIMQQEEK